MNRYVVSASVKKVLGGSDMCTHRLKLLSSSSIHNTVKLQLFIFFNILIAHVYFGDAKMQGFLIFYNIKDAFPHDTLHRE